MYQIDFHKPLHIHFIGIGGISMSGLTPNPALLLRHLSKKELLFTTVSVPQISQTT